LEIFQMTAGPRRSDVEEEFVAVDIENSGEFPLK
jgi:hypothetical protein